MTSEGMWRVALVVPYFGKFPNYFQLVLNSCGCNSRHFDWLFFTDDRREYHWPSNVKVYYTSFEEIRSLFQSKFDFPIALDRPYKFCDYKPAYGYVFSEYLQGYTFWGHCDIDCIFGDFDAFLSDSILTCDKIMRLGHLTLYKNTEENNKRFMLPVDGVYRYREVYSTDKSCLFDEENALNNLCVRDIWKAYNFTECCYDEAIANTSYKSDVFRLLYQVGDGAHYTQEPRIRSLFFWDHGSLVRIWEEAGELKRKNYMYMHLMRRPMKVPVADLSKIRVVKIMPNAFELASLPTDKAEFRDAKWHYWNLQYFRTRMKNLRVKIYNKLTKDSASC